MKINYRVQERTFSVREDMTTEDIRKSNEATECQKKYAPIFEYIDGKPGFSLREAIAINKCTFTEHENGDMTMWVKQEDGTKKGKRYSKQEVEKTFNLIKSRFMK